jgi:hypothetical protein|tara:strand:- start:848 stop:1168 length:321 start_codon:yes stop_codon:yes gene_type:complete
MVKKKERNTSNKGKEGLGIAGFTLGIVGLLLIIFLGPLNIPIHIVGLIFCWIQQKKNPTKLGKAGLIINIVGLIIDIFFIYYIFKYVVPQIQEIIDAGGVNNLPLV